MVVSTRTSAPVAEFASWLRRRRGDLFITQELLADEAGLSVRTIRYLESGRTQPRPYTRDAIMVALAHLAARTNGSINAGTPSPAQLPVDLAAFVDRADARDELDRIAEGAGAAARVALIIGGPGIGKTTLAVHWAHRAGGMFPDGQLFTDLKGFSAAAAPEDPDEVIQGFLAALGVPAERVPRRAAERIGLYRTILAGRRVLVVLDNARDADQVRSLLPGSAGSMAVVTSRGQLPDLVAADGARPVTIRPCTPAEGRALLAARLGAARVESEPAATDELVRLCAGMPLALGVVAARAAVHPDFPLADLAVDLKNTHDGDLTADLHAAMSWSYTALSAPAARVFRILGLHPHPDVTADVISAVGGLPPAGARDALDQLAEANLLTEGRPGRFAMHDVVHVYARELADHTIGEPARDELRSRFHEHYASVVAAAVAILCPHHELNDEPLSASGIPRPEIRDADHAVAILTAEQGVLYDVLRDAERRGEPRLLWRLASSLFIFLERQGQWRSLIAVARLATTAAERLQDNQRRFDAGRLLARAYARNGAVRAARQRLEAAIQLAEKADDPVAGAASHFDLAVLFDSEDRHAESAHHFGRALQAYRRIDDVAGEATALNAIGWARLHLGEPETAVEYCRRGLVLHGIVGNPHGEASTLDTYGLAMHRVGDLDKSIEAYLSALELIPATGDRHLESTLLEHLGDAWESAGNVVRARVAREQALAILDDISPALAHRFRTRLRLSAAR
jgi:tetratricopeptide (TPR) repeat protein/transcriptional regulator with XRE-family HTH domain